MFEKEAEEYAMEYSRQYLHNDGSGLTNSYFETYNGYYRGANDGYNKAKEEFTTQIKQLKKANEWHYIKNGDIVKEKGFYLVTIKDNGLALAYWNGLHWETKYNMGDFGHCVETVIAWKEIIPPKEAE